MCKTILKVSYLINILWISLENGDCFDFNHSLSSVYLSLYIITLLGRVYHFSLLICYPCSFSKKKISHILGKYSSYISGSRTFKAKLEKLTQIHTKKISYNLGNGTFLPQESLMNFFIFFLDKIPKGETECFSNLYHFLVAHASSFVSHHSFLNTVSYATVGALQLTVQPCVTYRMPYHDIGHQLLPTEPLPRQVEDFPRGGNYPKDVSLLPFLGYVEPV